MSFSARDGRIHFCVNERFEYCAFLWCRSGATGEQRLHPIILSLGEVLIGLKPLNQHYRFLNAVSPFRGQCVERLTHCFPKTLAVSSNCSEPTFTGFFLIGADGDSCHRVAFSLQQMHRRWWSRRGVPYKRRFRKERTRRDDCHSLLSYAVGLALISSAMPGGNWMRGFRRRVYRRLGEREAHRVRAKEFRLLS